MVTCNKPALTNMLPIMPINPLMMALKTTATSGSVSGTTVTSTLTSSLPPLTRIGEESTEGQIKERFGIRPRLTFSIEALVGSKASSKLSKGLSKNEYVKSSAESYAQAMKSRSSSPTVSNNETNDEVNVTSSRSPSPATAASNQRHHSHNIESITPPHAPVRPFPIQAPARINSNPESGKSMASSSRSDLLKSCLPAIAQPELKSAGSSSLPIRAISSSQNHLLAAQFQMAVLAHHHHNHLLPQQQQNPQQSTAPSIPLPSLGMANATAAHLPPGYPFGFIPHHQIPPSGPVYVGSTHLVRDTYPLYPWLLSRHGRIFSHRFPGICCFLFIIFI